MSASEDSDFDPQDETDSSSDAGPSAQVQGLLSVQSAPNQQPETVDEDVSMSEVKHKHIRSDGKSDMHSQRTQSVASEGFLKDYAPTEENSYTAEESYFTRPNRYFGPAATWQDWTREDRNVAESLDRERAQDLSVHLYNSFALRKNGVLRVSNPTSKSKGKQRAHSSDESGGNLLWDSLLSHFWTAWPLPPDEVPRSSFIPSLSLSPLLRTASRPRPSDLVEECLIATTTNLARERWRGRRWMWRPKSEDVMDLGEPVETLEQPLNTHLDASDQQEDAEVEGSPVQTFASQVPESSDDSSSPGKSFDNVDDEEMYKVNIDARPVPLADEDRARWLILPSTRHVLSKFDNLLIALHKTRQVYATISTRETDDVLKTDQVTDTDATNGRSKSRGRTRKRKIATSAESKILDDFERSSSSGRRRKLRKSRLGLRDWSDVMGMASLSGWDSATVERASARCALLFGENMLFRTFREGCDSEKSFFTEQLATGDEPAFKAEQGKDPAERRADQASSTDDDALSITWSRNPSSEWGRPRTCPYQWCKRHTNPFRKPYQAERHVATVHANDPPLSSSNEVEVEERWTLGDLGGISSAKAEIFCPFKRCRRGLGKPFSTTSKMYNHVRRMHPDVNLKDLKRVRPRMERRAQRKDGHETDDDLEASGDWASTKQSS